MNILSPVALAAAPVTRASQTLTVAQQLLEHLERGQRVDAAILRAAMETAFGASDTSGAWDWKAAYEACEVATVLFLRKYGKALFRKAASPAARFSAFSKIAGFDAAQIDDHLAPDATPSVVLMNPPFSVMANVSDAAYRHIASALARLADGGRLVAITGANFSPKHPAWAAAFVRLQDRGRIVFTAAVDGSVYAKHGTTIDTRLTVIDKLPADDRSALPLRQASRPTSPRCSAGSRHRFRRARHARVHRAGRRRTRL